MADLRPLPRLAAMFLTNDHEVPAEVLTLLSAPAADADGGAWECPLNGAREFGVARGAGVVAMRPPAY